LALQSQKRDGSREVAAILLRGLQGKQHFTHRKARFSRERAVFRKHERLTLSGQTTKLPSLARGLDTLVGDPVEREPQRGAPAAAC
jgi:hypothetical protein